MSPFSLLTSRVMTNNWFKYFVPKLLADRAKLVKLANIAKNVAFKWDGADCAIHANIGIIDTCPKGLSRAVLKMAMKRASINPFVIF